MKKAWSVVGTIVLVMILLGGICIAVGYVTGGSTEAVLTRMEARYHLSVYFDAYLHWFQDLLARLVALWPAA